MAIIDLINDYIKIQNFSIIYIFFIVYWLEEGLNIKLELNLID